VDLRVKVSNTGIVAGDEAVQAYLDKPAKTPVNVQFAISTLAGFERVSLNAGESKTVVLHVPLRQFQYGSAEMQAWVTPEGVWTLWVGGSSRDHRLQIKTNPQRAGASISKK
jgi:beta-glucosidase